MPAMKIKVKTNTNGVDNAPTATVEDSPKVEVMETKVPVTNKFDVPKHLFSGFTDILRNEQLKFAKQVAEDFGLDYTEVIEKCLPDQPSIELTERVAPTRTTKQKKTKLTNFADAQVLEDLKGFKMGDLKAILEENDLPISGPKPLLMARVWGINHPDDAPSETKKKRGRPAKSKTPNTVEANSPDDNVEECELDADKMPTIFVESDGSVVENKSDSTKDYKLLKDKFVFQEGNEEMDFKGTVEDGKVIWSEDIPEELLKLLGMEE